MEWAHDAAKQAAFSRSRAIPHQAPMTSDFIRNHSPQDTETVISTDGLRYASKPPGSPFAPGSSGSYSTMSCFWCGLHRGGTQRKLARIMGRARVVCDPVCGANPASKAVPKVTPDAGETP
jgi:hypothetical protein